MTVVDDELLQLKKFAESSNFAKQGSLVLDLDGTALHEREGKVYVPGPIEQGIIDVQDLGRQVILNTLRFPLSLIRTVGPDWYNISRRPIPAVLLNGSSVGFLDLDPARQELGYQELQAFPIAAEEIEKILAGVQNLVDMGLTDLILFYYPRDWRQGEIIWTPDPNCVNKLKDRYSSCSGVISSSVGLLRQTLLQDEVCMIFLLINAEGDKLMAYQHTNKNSYFTRSGVDKKYGLKKLAENLEISLPDSVGAGDTELDTFLEAVGLAIHVRSPDLESRGIFSTLQAANSFELGELISKFTKFVKPA